MRSQSQKNAFFIWKLLPVVTLWLGLIVMLLLFSFHPAFVSIAPIIPAMILSWWVWERRSIGLLIWAVVVSIGVDMLTGLPIGFSALPWLVAGGIIRVYARHVDVEDGFALRWFHTALAFAALHACQWGLAWWLGLGQPAIMTIMAAWGLMVLLYPLVHLLLAMLKRRVQKWLWLHLPAEI